MRFQKKYAFRMVIAALSVALIVGTGTSHAQYSPCGPQYNNIGPGDEYYCYYDDLCPEEDGYVCEENDCSNCQGEPTGVNSFCVSDYDCGSIPGCIKRICT
jgi:hypothetical protein